MARAKRHFLPGHAWHITHRCHEKQFLLKFGRDRDRWLHWLFEARKRYKLCILNYVATSNHIHLLVMDRSEREAIPRSMQLAAGRTGQEYNHRKLRKGAFWEDRYHATAVQTGEHLIRCMVYMDLNMVRAGAVQHPSEWDTCGYNEIQSPKKRYGLIDHNCLLELLGLSSMGALEAAHGRWVEQAIEAGEKRREEKWTGAIAVGGRSFVEEVKGRLNIRAKGRRVIEQAEDCCLREGQDAYGAIFQGEKGTLSPGNMHYWNIYNEESIG